MTNDEDYVLVNGNFTTATSTNHNGQLTAGTLEVKGNFTQSIVSQYDNSSYNFRPTDSHKVILSGANVQTMKFASGYSYFNILEVTKPLATGYKFDTSTRWGQLIEKATSDPTAGTELKIANNWTLSYDVEVESLALSAGTIDLNGYTLTVTKGVTVSGGTLNLNGGTLNITGKLQQTGGIVKVNEGKLLIGSDYSLSGYNSTLQMTNDEDYVLVNGNFTTATGTNHTGQLTAGTLEIKENFTQSGAYYNFRTSNSHKVILSGTNVQTMKFAYPGDSYFNILEVTKPIVTGYIFGKDVKWVQLIENLEIKIVPVTGISLNKNALTLKPNNSEKLMYTIAPVNATNKSVKWSSSNVAVATVDSTGKVTALKEGNAVITVMTEDGQKTSTATVTVQSATIPVTGITLNKTSITLQPGKNETLTITVSPTNATNKNVKWSSDNVAVATVDASGKVQAVKDGVATIKVTTEDGQKTATVKVNVKTENTGIPNVSIEDKFSTIYKFSELVTNIGLFNSILSEYTAKELKVIVPDKYLTNITVTHTNLLTNIDVKTNTNVRSVIIRTQGKDNTAKRVQTTEFTSSLAALPKGEEVIVIAKDASGQEVEKKVLRIKEGTTIIEQNLGTIISGNYEMLSLISNTVYFNNLLNKFSLDELKVGVPVRYIKTVEANSNAYATTFTVTTEGSPEKITIVTADGTESEVISQGNGIFTLDIIGLQSNDSVIIRVYNQNGNIIEEVPAFVD